MVNRVTFGHLNVHGLGSKARQLELERFLYDVCVDVFCVQETWFGGDQGVPLPRLAWEGRNRVAHAGGVGIYVSSSIRYKRRADLERDDLECVWIETPRGGGLPPLLVASVYIPPRDLPAIHRLGDVLASIPPGAPRLLLGDFNAAHLAWGAAATDPAGRLLGGLVEASGLKVCNDPASATFYTRTGSPRFPDLSIVSAQFAGLVNEWRVCEGVGSDHLPVLFALETCVDRRAVMSRQILNLGKADWGLFREELQPLLQRWQERQVGLDIDSAYDSLVQLMHTCARRAIPRKGVSAGAKPWWSAELSRLTRVRDRCRRKYQRTGLFAWHEKYCEARRAVRRIIRRRKASYLERLASDLCHSRASPAKLFSRATKAQVRSAPSSAASAQEASARATSLNQFFSEAGRYVGSQSLPSAVQGWQERVERRFTSEARVPPASSEPAFSDGFTPAEYASALSRCGTDKAQGSDGVHTAFLKNGGAELSASILGLVNRSWTEGQLPQAWRDALIHPIPNVPRPSNDGEYRPISLLSIVGKIMERMVTSRLYRFAERRGILPTYQSGFRQKHSTLDHLVTIQHEAHAAFSRRESLILALLDVRKAYDSVWRAGLYDRLRAVGVDGRMLNWIRAYLSGRRSRVLFDGVMSGWCDSLFGVPQGSPLSPLLYNIFSSPALHRVTFGRALFADDIAIFASGKDMQSLERQCTDQLARISRWGQRWRVCFNTKKSCVTFFSRSPNVAPPRVRFEGDILRYDENPSYLGLTLDQRMRWGRHIQSVAAGAQRRFGQIRGLAATAGKVHPQKLVAIYKTCVRPKVEYGCQVWNDAAKELKSRHIDSLQHAVLARIFRVPLSASSEALQVEAGTPPLELRREYLTARAYRRIASSRSAVSVLLRSHAAGELCTLNSSVNRSFFSRGEELINTRFRSRNLKLDLVRSWQQQWTSSERCRVFFDWQPAVSLRMQCWQRRFRPSLLCALIGMRVQAPLFRLHRHRIGVASSPQCRCGDVESTDHFWLECPLYSEAREELVRTFRNVTPEGTPFDTKGILSFNQRGVSLHIWISAVRRYIARSKRLNVD